MSRSDVYRLVIARDTLHVSGALWLRTAIAAVFAMLVGMFLTAPVGGDDSVFGAPLPMPAELLPGPAPWDLIS